MNKKRIFSIVLAGVLLIGVLAACTPAQQATDQAPDQTPTTTPTPPTQGTTPPPPPTEDEGFQRGIVVASMGETPSIAPGRHSTLLGSHKHALTHNALFRAEYQTLAVVPDLVTEWRTLSDTVFEFTIREGVQFHNGDIMTAHDVSASFYYLRTYPDRNAVQGSIYSWEVLDDHTIRIDTGRPSALFFSDLTDHGNMVLPLSLIEAGHDFQAVPVGSGPYVFQEWSRGDFLYFTAFENYWDAERFPNVGSVLWRIIPEGTSRTIALETGEVNYVVDVSLPDIARLEAINEITVKQRPGIMWQGFFMNNDAHPFDNIIVRQAVDMAFDRDAMVLASLDGYGIPIRTTMPPMFAGATTEGTRPYDPEGARALLAEHGIDPASIGFEILFFDEVQRRRAEVAQASLAEIGIPVTLNHMEFGPWMALTLTDQYQSSFANHTVTSLVAFLRNMMHEDFIGTFNPPRIRNAELNELINQALVTVDENARVAILYEASKIANEHAGLIGVNMNIVFRAFNADLIVPELGPNGALYVNMMYWVD